MKENWDEAFLKAGVVILEIKDVPLYWLDINDCNVMYRKLNGIIDRGTWKDGGFIKERKNNEE